MIKVLGGEPVKSRRLKIERVVYEQGRVRVTMVDRDSTRHELARVARVDAVASVDLYATFWCRRFVRAPTINQTAFLLHVGNQILGLATVVKHDDAWRLREGRSKPEPSWNVWSLWVHDSLGQVPWKSFLLRVAAERLGVEQSELGFMEVVPYARAMEPEPEIAEIQKTLGVDSILITRASGVMLSCAATV